MITGIGIDLIEIERVEHSLRKFPGRFEKRVFTETEQAYCRAMAVPARHYAARFAAKEAFLKAIGTGKSHGIAWTDVGIVNLASGQPELRITGRAFDIFLEQGVQHIHVSLSHNRQHAVAVVVLENDAVGNSTASS